MTVRRAEPTDAHAIAAIHVHAWQNAYRGIVPQSYLDSLSVQGREVVWQRNLEQRSSETLVAEQDGTVLGWISVGRSRDQDAEPSRGELWAIYVDPQHCRKGIGRISDSCGYGVPLLAFEANRTQLRDWVCRKGEQGLVEYEREKNIVSIDGLPALRWPEGRQPE